jgi:hypothetical protein
MKIQVTKVTKILMLKHRTIITTMITTKHTAKQTVMRHINQKKAMGDIRTLTLAAMIIMAVIIPVGVETKKKETGKSLIN